MNEKYNPKKLKLWLSVDFALVIWHFIVFRWWYASLGRKWILLFSQSYIDGSFIHLLPTSRAVGGQVFRLPTACRWAHGSVLHVRTCRKEWLFWWVEYRLFEQFHFCSICKVIRKIIVHCNLKSCEYFYNWRAHLAMIKLTKCHILSW